MLLTTNSLLKPYKHKGRKPETRWTKPLILGRKWFWWTKNSGCHTWSGSERRKHFIFCLQWWLTEKIRCGCTHWFILTQTVTRDHHEQEREANTGPNTTASLIHPHTSPLRHPVSDCGHDPFRLTPGQHVTGSGTGVRLAWLRPGRRGVTLQSVTTSLKKKRKERKKVHVKTAELICRSSAPPSPAGTAGSGCSASPTETCSSCGTSGCILPKPLETQRDESQTQGNTSAISSPSAVRFTFTTCSGPITAAYCTDTVNIEANYNY